MFDLRKTLHQAHKTLKMASVSHALIGGFAMAAYGYHRATADIDLLADGTKRDLIKTELMKNGFVVVHETEEIIQFSGIGFLDVLLANRPISQRMLNQAQASKELEILILKPEDIIGLKIQAYKNDFSRELQDKADIQKLLALPNMDLSVVKQYADLFDEWSAIKQIVGKQ